MQTRKATHADGIWYANSPQELGENLASWLDRPNVSRASPRAIIAPHAGYKYSGPCAGVAYKQIDPTLVKRIFIIGPSHHERFKLCALPSADKYETPLYDISVDTRIVKDLMETGAFEFMSISVDEKEHSVEMHLPFIAKVMESYSREFTIVPILVNTNPSYEQNQLYGKILSLYLLDSSNLFIVSSDFCHWGPHFDYTYYEENSGVPIYQFIQELDKMGMDLIEQVNVRGFYNYLKKYRNTICGRYPILILLHAIEEITNGQLIEGVDVKFLEYAQSNQCRSAHDQSVSYASATVIINN